MPVWQRRCNCGFRSHESSPGDCYEEKTIRFVYSLASDGAERCFVFRKPADIRAECFRLIPQYGNSTTADATGQSKCG